MKCALNSKKEKNYTLRVYIAYDYKPLVTVSVYDSNYIWMGNATTDSNGQYILSGLPSGEHRVSFSANTIGYINEWYMDKADFITADPVTVTAPATTTNIDAVLQQGGNISKKEFQKIRLKNTKEIENIKTRFMLLDFEITTTNLSNIPKRSLDRDGRYPIILAGGTCAFNPRCMEGFIDCFLIGEAEEAFLEVKDIINKISDSYSIKSDDKKERIFTRIGLIISI